MSFLVTLTDPHRTLVFETDQELPILDPLVQRVSSQLHDLNIATALNSFKTERVPGQPLIYNYDIFTNDGRHWSQKFTFVPAAHNEPAMTFSVPHYWRLIEFLPHRDLRDAIFLLVRNLGLVRVEATYGPA